MVSCHFEPYYAFVVVVVLEEETDCNYHGQCVEGACACDGEEVSNNNFDGILCRTLFV